MVMPAKRKLYKYTGISQKHFKDQDEEAEVFGPLMGQIIININKSAISLMGFSFFHLASLLLQNHQRAICKHLLNSS